MFNELLSTMSNIKSPQTDLGQFLPTVFASQGNFSPLLFNKTLDLYNQKYNKNEKNPFNKYVNNYMGSNVVKNIKEYKGLIDNEKAIYGAKEPGFSSLFLNAKGSVNRTSPYEEVLKAGKIRAESLNKLVDSDISHTTTNLGTNMALLQGENLAKNFITQKAVGKATELIADKVGDKLKDKFKNYNQDQIAKVITETSDRISGFNRSKLGLMDIAKFINPVPIMLGSAGLKAGNAVVKQGLMGVLGVQDAYHATSNESAKKIVEHGLDPSRGGQKGGATRALMREAYESNKIYPTIKAAPLISQQRDAYLKVPVYDLFDQAVQRSYVGTGLVGKGSVGYYAAKTNPEGFMEKVKNVIESTALARKQLEQTSFKNPIKKIKAFANTAKEVAKTPLKVNDLYNFLYSKNPEEMKIVATAMPFNEFHQRFEPDPQDVAYLRTGYRTKRPKEIDPLGEKTFTMTDDQLDKHVSDALEGVSKSELQPIKNFRPGELSYADIIKARTPLSEYGKFLGTSKGRKHFAKGVAYLGGGGLLSYQGAKVISKPYIGLYNKVKGDSAKVKDLITKKRAVELNETLPLTINKSETVDVIDKSLKENKSKIIDKFLTKRSPILMTLGAGALATGIGTGLYYNKEK